jgi:hypothetical protein
MARAKKDAPSELGKQDAEVVSEELVRTAAYYHWEKRGRPAGDEWYDWLEAEKEIKEWMTASGILPPKKKK